MSDKWCTIESDPGKYYEFRFKFSSRILTTYLISGVFTELVQKIGVKGIEFEELFVLEDDIMNQIK